MKLLAIDDQPAVLEMLCRQINLEKLGLEQMDIASSAGEAREKLAAQTYEIILCDIEMPEEDGISFAKWAMEEYPASKLIFLTSHADFDYVREAVSLHSFDYLLQPASQEQLEETIRKAELQFQVEEESRKLMEDGQFYQLQKEEVLRGTYLEYVEEGTGEEKLLRSLEKNCPGFTRSSPAAPLLLHLWRTDPTFETIEPKLFLYGMENILGELLEPLGLRCFLTRKDAQRYVGLLYVLGEIPSNGSVFAVLKKTQKFLEEIYGVKLTVYYAPWGELSQIALSCRRMERLLAENVTQREPVVLAGSEPPKVVREVSFDRQKKVWSDLLSQGEFSSFKKSVLEYLENVVEKDDLSLRFMADLHRAFTEVLLTYLLEKNIDSGSIFNGELPYDRYMSTYTRLEDFENMVSFVAEKLRESSGISDDVIGECSRFIREHIDENISVTEIAGRVGLSPEHLTRLFRKGTGYSIKEYLIREKMEASKMFLRTTQLSVTEIAGHVGYDNYSNFIKIFKKYVGCSPAEYRKDQEKKE
jgi:two-component system response regulator YesN